MYQLFNKFGIELSGVQIKQFNQFYQLLIDWNNKMNLTAITDYNEVIDKHFLDSCLLLKVFDKEIFLNKAFIDVGTGAGFPGIPLAILLSDTNFTLIDSIQKRIGFIEIVIEQLGLTNVKLYHGRAENLAREVFLREQFDYCVSRAVAPLPLLLEYCSPFIKVDGSLLLYKSRKSNEEIEEASNALKELCCDIHSNFLIRKEDRSERNIIQIMKRKHTPEKYPRRAGKPKKSPL